MAPGRKPGADILRGGRLEQLPRTVEPELAVPRSMPVTSTPGRSEQSTSVNHAAVRARSLGGVSPARRTFGFEQRSHTSSALSLPALASSWTRLDIALGLRAELYACEVCF